MELYIWVNYDLPLVFWSNTLLHPSHLKKYLFIPHIYFLVYYFIPLEGLISSKKSKCEGWISIFSNVKDEIVYWIKIQGANHNLPIYIQHQERNWTKIQRGTKGTVLLTNKIMFLEEKFKLNSKTKKEERVHSQINRPIPLLPLDLLICSTLWSFFF